MPQPDISDDSIMPWGPHKDTRMGDLPAEHQLWLLNQSWITGYKPLHKYLLAKKEALLAQVAKKPKPEEGDVEEIQSYDDYLRSYRGF